MQRLAIAGIIGPVAFIACWVAGSIILKDYSPIQDPISRLAEPGVETRRLMTVGLVVFGIGMLVYAASLYRAFTGWSWTAAIIAGGATFGVIFFPLKNGESTPLHAAFAALGYIALICIVAFAIPMFVHDHRTAWVVFSAIVVVVSAVNLGITGFGFMHGLFQRVGLTTLDVWIILSAIQIQRGSFHQ